MLLRGDSVHLARISLITTWSGLHHILRGWFGGQPGRIKGRPVQFLFPLTGPMPPFPLSYSCPTPVEMGDHLPAQTTKRESIDQTQGRPNFSFRHHGIGSQCRCARFVLSFMFSLHCPTRGPPHRFPVRWKWSPEVVTTAPLMMNSGCIRPCGLFSSPRAASWNKEKNKVMTRPGLANYVRILPT